MKKAAGEPQLLHLHHDRSARSDHAQHQSGNKGECERRSGQLPICGKNHRLPPKVVNRLPSRNRAMPLTFCFLKRMRPGR
jgi:hypothetical protein